MTQQVPPGWYPDPQLPQRSRWYDGTQWTEHTGGSVAGAQQPGRPHLGDGWFQLTRVVQVALGLVILVDLGWLLWANRAHHFIDDVRQDPASVSIARGQDLDRLEVLVTVAGLAVLLVTGVLFIIWLFQAHRSDAMDPADLNHASGWAIGGWFVPILSLWRPYGVVQDVHRAGSDRQESTFVMVWWLSFLVNQIATLAGSAAIPEPDVPDDQILDAMSSYAGTMTVTSWIEIVAAVIAIVLVQRMAGAVRHGVERNHRMQVTGR